MAQLIKDNKIIDNQWTTLSEEDCQQDITAGNVIIPLKVWIERKDELSNRDDIGVWFEGTDEPENTPKEVMKLPLIAVNFPKFADGRGYSIARVLRERQGFEGELRAIGDILRDQLFFLNRCGFNAYEVRSDRDLTDALNGLNDFSGVYQGAADDKAVLFNR